jgi:Protein of unknown function (DUF3089)
VRRVRRALVAVAVLAALNGAATARAHTIWLCRPGQRPDPCLTGLSTTLYTPAEKRIGVEHPKPVAKPAVDCFYVYPTVSSQPTGNANLEVQPEERSIALYQAARYSQYCRVFAPMYRQVTLAGIGLGQPTTAPDPALALSDIEHAFKDYLAHYNHGRGFILIGHSQGALELERLIQADVDRKPAVRGRLVSAILLGGNVLVKGKTGIGGDFKHIPACRSGGQVGCVIAFSTFDEPPPSDSYFGFPSSLGLGPPPPSGDRVLCTNPAALAGGTGLLDPIFPSAPFAAGTVLAAAIAALNVPQPHPNTVWWTSRGAYRARCVSSNGADVLLVVPRDGAPQPTPSPTPEWGLHLMDANIALGNLLTVVGHEIRAFASAR